MGLLDQVMFLISKLWASSDRRSVDMNSPDHHDLWEDLSKVTGKQFGVSRGVTFRTVSHAGHSEPSETTRPVSARGGTCSL